RGNRIHDNGGLGIALAGAGLAPTPNDPGDADEGPNRLQNFPEIASAILGELSVDVAYFVPTDPANASYPLTIDFYLSSADGEGQTWIGAQLFDEADHAAGTPKVVTDALAFVGEPPHVVATATDAEGNTSEFSAPVQVPEPAAGPLAALAALAVTRFPWRARQRAAARRRWCSPHATSARSADTARWALG